MFSPKHSLLCGVLAHLKASESNLRIRRLRSGGNNDSRGGPPTTRVAFTATFLRARCLQTLCNIFTRLRKLFRFSKFSLFIYKPMFFHHLRYHILASTSWLPNPSFNILATTSWPPDSGVHILASTSWPLAPDYQILTSRSWLPHPGFQDPGYQILAATSWLPDPGFQILATTFCFQS